MTLESLAREMRELRAQYNDLDAQYDRTADHLSVLSEKRSNAYRALLSSQKAMIKLAMEAP